MEILFQSHHAQVSDRMRRARRAVRSASSAPVSRRAVDARRPLRGRRTRRAASRSSSMRRRQRAMVAEGSARFFGPALAYAHRRISKRKRGQLKRTPQGRAVRKLAARVNRPLTVGAARRAPPARASSSSRSAPAGLDRARDERRRVEPGARAGRLRRSFRRPAPAGVRRDRDHVPLLARATTERERISRMFFAFPVPCVFVTKGSGRCRRVARGHATERGVADLPLAAQDRRVLSAASSRSSRICSRRRRRCTGRSPTCSASACFFTGQSGIGKSECVLDLVERGHRLVADDLVIVHAARQRRADRPRPRAAAPLHGDSRRRARSTSRRSSAFAPCGSRSASRSSCSSRNGTRTRSSTARASTRETTDDPRRRAAEDHGVSESGKEHHGDRRSHRDESSAALQRREPGRGVQRAPDRAACDEARRREAVSRGRR